jgi:hypothetical protein
MHRSWLRGSAWGVGASLLLVGCDPKILAFDVQPGRVCGGDTVHIAWKVRGTPHVLTDRLTVDSVNIIRYTLVVESHGKKAVSSKDVITFTPGTPKVLAANTDMLGPDSLVARDSTRAAGWHSLVQVGEVGSGSGRALLVSHEGREGVVGPGREASPVWRGLPISGLWEIRSRLKAHEVPGNGTRHPPQRLFLKVSLVCAGKGGLAGPAATPAVLGSAGRGELTVRP